MAPIHVVYIITQLELGGAQKVCLTLFKASSPYTKTLISGTEGFLVASIQDHDNCFLLPSLKRELSYKTVFQEIRCFFTLITLLKKLKKQHAHLIVHTHSSKAGILGRWAAYGAGIPVRIHTVHGFAFHAYQSRRAFLCYFITEWFTAFITTHTIVVSTADQNTGTRFLPFFKKNHSLIRAALHIETQPHYPQFPTQSPFIFGTIACFKPQKNLIDLLRAFATVNARNSTIYLEIIGDGEQRSFLESIIEKYQLTAHVILHGWQDDVQFFMKRWHAFILSSLWEGLPCSIVEARSLKLPILCYDVGGIRDIIYHGKNGFLMPPQQYETLAQYMHMLATSPELYKHCVDYADDFTDFTQESMLKHHENLYTKLCKSL